MLFNYLEQVNKMEIFENELNEARRIKAYFPYRRTWIAKKQGEETQYITKPTAHLINSMVRAGWSAWEIK